MCDYSLMSVPNRLAQEGEDLVSHRFETGTMGLASQADLLLQEAQAKNQSRGLWESFKAFFAPPPVTRTPAVCIPPGARLLLMDIAEGLREDLAVGRVEEVTFTQITASANSYRDAFRFRNGREALLQKFPEGLRVRVLALGAEAGIERVRTLAERW